jgi:hypothetical protein
VTIEYNVMWVKKAMHEQFFTLYDQYKFTLYLEDDNYVIGWILHFQNGEVERKYYPFS